MDDKKPIKISLKTAVIIIVIVLLAIIGGIIYFVNSNSKKEEQVVTTKQGQNCTTNTYISYKEIPTNSDIEYDVIKEDMYYYSPTFDNALIKSKEELNKYLEKDFDIIKINPKTEKEMYVFKEGYDNTLKFILAKFDDKYFEEHNLAINAGAFEVVSVNIQNGQKTINLKRLYSEGVTATPQYYNFITLNKDVEKINFDVYNNYCKSNIIDVLENYWPIISICIEILLIIVTLKIILKSKNKIITSFMILVLFGLILITIFSFMSISINYTSVDKPIIYLYPTKETEINIDLEKSNSITTSYPKYINGWHVKADSNGDLIDLNTGKNLYALYYENKANIKFNVTNDGFCIKGENIASFLEEKLRVLGLNDRETEEFIIYWLPKLEKNKYNYIRFASNEEINQNMPINIAPTPDTFIRVLMVYKPLNKQINVKEQNLKQIEREGFTAVEWGGTEIN